MLCFIVKRLAAEQIFAYHQRVSYSNEMHSVCTIWSVRDFFATALILEEIKHLTYFQNFRTLTKSRHRICAKCTLTHNGF